MGDPQRAEFERFVAAHGDRLLYAAYGLCGDWQHAEDLVQQALIAVARRWPDLTVNPLGYAYRSLTRANIDRWRVLRRRPEILFAPHDLASVHVTAAAEAPETHLAVLTALGCLPPRQRAIVVLRYLQDLSESDVADADTERVGAVKSGAARGLAKLRAAQPNHLEGLRHD
jgi:RNA polymerase sigma-70 factor (sigma-E family)